MRVKLFSRNNFIFRGKLNLTNAHFQYKIIFLGQRLQLHRHLLQPELIDHHQTWYGYNWNMWWCNWDLHFCLILPYSKSTGLKLKKMAVLSVFCCSLKFYRHSVPFFLFISLNALKGNVFVPSRSKFDHYKSFPSISDSVWSQNWYMWSYCSIKPLLIFSSFNCYI